MLNSTICWKSINREKSTLITKKNGFPSVTIRVVTRFGKSFVGVYPRDLLPNQLRPYEKAIVVNTDSQDQPRTHWCAYIGTELMWNISILTDYLPMYQEIRQFISRHSRHWTYNHNCYRDYSTDVCGQYCVYFYTNAIEDTDEL